MENPFEADIKRQIERLTNVIRATEMERDAGDKVSDNLRDRIKWLEIGILTKDRVIAELRKAAAELEDHLAQATQALKEADEHIRILEAERRE